MDQETKTQRILQAGARWLLTFAVVISPWMFGTSDPWVQLILSGLSCTGCLLWLLALGCSPNPTVRFHQVAVAIVALIAFVILQRLPIPFSWVQALNPAAAEQHRTAIDLLDLLRFRQPLTPLAAGLNAFPALSFSPGGTDRSLYLLVAYISAFLVMANTLRTWEQIQRVGGAIVVSTFIMAVLGTVHKFSGSQEIFWFRAPRFGGNVFGPFTNRNHFAAYANMVFGIALGLLLSSRHFRQILAWPSWRDKLSWVSSRSASRTILCAFAVIMLGAAVCFSLSRGAMLSLILSVAIFGGISGWRQRGMARARSAIIVLFLLLIVALWWIGMRDVIERLGTLAEIARNPSADYRFIVTLDTLTVFGACPLVGCGFGAFRHVYSLFQTPSLDRRWLHAHNDWAQLLAEGGIVGALLFALVLVLWFRALRTRFPFAAGKARLMAVGLLLGLTTIAFHSLVDYSLHRAANALLLAAIAGMAAATVHVRRRSPETPFRSPPLRTALVRVLSTVGVLSLTLLVVSKQSELRGELAFTRFLYLRSLATGTETPAERQQAVTRAAAEANLVAASIRHNPDALAEVTGALLRWSGDLGLDRPMRVELAEQALQTAFLAVAGAPADYLTWLALARCEMTLGFWDEGELCLERARQLVWHRREVRMFAPAEPEPGQDGN